jgi:prepilin signal peptidase PulO-like enzyme (type II secretory pathway)
MGKCKSCKNNISISYPLTELLLAALFLFIALRYSQGWFLPAQFDQSYNIFIIRDLTCVFFLSLISLSDIYYGKISNRIFLIAAVFITIIQYFAGLRMSELIIASCVIGGFFACQYFISKGSLIGGADVLFGILMGIILGLEQGLIAMFFAYLFAAIIGILLIIRSKASGSSKLPFIPFLSAATVIILLTGEFISNWYISLIFT